MFSPFICCHWFPTKPRRHRPQVAKVQLHPYPFHAPPSYKQKWKENQHHLLEPTNLWKYKTEKLNMFLRYQPPRFAQIPSDFSYFLLLSRHYPLPNRCILCTLAFLPVFLCSLVLHTLFNLPSAFLLDTTHLNTDIYTCYKCTFSCANVKFWKFFHLLTPCAMAKPSHPEPEMQCSAIVAGHLLASFPLPLRTVAY